MKELEKAKELIDKNRLLTVLSVAWVIISNLLYFSQAGELSCLNFITFVGSSTPDWIVLWNKLTLGYVTLYETISEPYEPSSISCARAGFAYGGYFSLALLPVFIMVLLTIAIRWIRRSPP
jgi:hypothetical protein